MFSLTELPVRLILSFTLTLIMGIGLLLARPLPEVEASMMLTATLTPSLVPNPTRPALLFSANGRPETMYSDDFGIFQLYTTLDRDTPLTSDDSNAFDARLSPDGSRVVYTLSEEVGEFNVMVMDADGENPTRLTDGKTPDWSPDGTQIAFSREDGVYIMDADGENIRQVHADINVLELSYTPDGDELLLVVVVPDEGNMAYFLGVDDGILQPVLREGVPVMSIALAPDGEQLAWANREGLYISQDRGQTASWVRYRGTLSDILNEDMPTITDMRWSPDSKMVAFTVYSWRLQMAVSTPVPFERVGAQVAVYEVETGRIRLLTQGFTNNAPDWLPFATATP